MKNSLFCFTKLKYTKYSFNYLKCIRSYHYLSKSKSKSKYLNLNKFRKFYFTKNPQFKKDKDENFQEIEEGEEIRGVIFFLTISNK
jgi:hypothetical protein